MYDFFIALTYVDPTRSIQILAYTITAQIARLTALPNGFSIKLPTKWFLATMVPRGLQLNVLWVLSCRLLRCRIDGTTESVMVAYTHKYAKV